MRASATRAARRPRATRGIAQHLVAGKSERAEVILDPARGSIPAGGRRCSRRWSCRAAPGPGPGGTTPRVTEPPSFASPRAGSRSPSRVASSVVLPAPLGPTSATTSLRRRHRREVLHQHAVAHLHVDLVGHQRLVAPALVDLEARATSPRPRRAAARGGAVATAWRGAPWPGCSCDRRCCGGCSPLPSRSSSSLGGPPRASAISRSAFRVTNWV